MIALASRAELRRTNVEHARVEARRARGYAAAARTCIRAGDFDIAVSLLAAAFRARRAARAHRAIGALR
ncbi:hypothetical protein DB32_003203 [Sandaracinus amylolyticus]|uniref:Uncharacterized protein n=1 Tax=Sandaracinus amylolyticus TaxID=927083 RepID=A0A0F6SEZ5_9BACT|nr:hypothetical protein DB32_003203 [Sandaracinus amylolyticus]